MAGFILSIPTHREKSITPFNTPHSFDVLFKLAKEMGCYIWGMDNQKTSNNNYATLNRTN